MKLALFFALTFGISLAEAQSKSVSCVVDTKKSCDKCLTVAAQCGQSQNVVYLSVQEKPQTVYLQIFNSKNGSELQKEVPNKVFTLSDLLRDSSKLSDHILKLYPQKQSYEKVEITHFAFAGSITYSKTIDAPRGKSLKLADFSLSQKRGIASEAPAGKAGGVGRAKTEEK